MQTMLTNIGVEEAIAAFSRIGAVAPKRIPLFEATGLRLAEDVVIRRSAPASAIAALDGWAVAAAGTAGASRRRPVALGPDAVMIDAGSLLPRGADAVLPAGAAASRARGVVALRPAALAEGVLPAGGLAHPGMVLAPAGTRITFALAMALAQCGVTDVVVRRPVVDIIFNSVGMTRQRDHLAGVIGAAIRGSGCAIGAVQFTAGERALLTDTLLASSADVITVVGGTGAGPGDTTVEAIAAAGELVFHRIRLSPGGTAGFGMVGSKPVFASPGNLADMLAVNIVLSWPFARQAFGRPPLDPPRLRAPLGAALKGTGRESRLVFARHDDGVITPLDDGPPSPARLARANASIFIPEGARHRRRGESVPFMRLGVSV
jgi:molybdopterin molybdotransferase